MNRSLSAIYSLFGTTIIGRLVFKREKEREAHKLSLLPSAPAVRTNKLFRNKSGGGGGSWAIYSALLVAGGGRVDYNCQPLLTNTLSRRRLMVGGGGCGDDRRRSSSLPGQCLNECAWRGGGLLKWVERACPSFKDFFRGYGSSFTWTVYSFFWKFILEVRCAPKIFC